jgi:UDP-glucose 4-epimerase
MKKKFLVTGGAGFIGSHLSESLSRNAQVIVIDNLFQGNKLRLNKNIKLVKCDVRDVKMMQKYSKGCSAIFHLAAIIGVDVVSQNKVENMNIEFEGLKNICESAKRNKVKKIIYASSSGVYGKLNYEKKVREDAIIAPMSGYAMAKRAGEIYLNNFSKENKISCASVRLFNVYGKRQDNRMVIPRFIELAKKNKDIKIYNDGNQTRDFTHINDCVKTFELLEKKIKGYEVFNSSKGSDTKIIKLAQIITKLFNSKSKIKLIQTPKHLEEFQVQKRCGNSNKIFRYLQFKPSINLTDGLKEAYL